MDNGMQDWHDDGQAHYALELQQQQLTQLNSKRTEIMKAGAMVESKFLKKEDLDYDNGNLVTITKLDQQNVGMNDGEEDLKWCMHFKEFNKPMVMNSTNIQLTTKALATDETDDWIGKKIVIYVDDNVSFGGKLVGGIRIRKVRGQAAAKQAQPREDQTEQVRGHADRVGVRQNPSRTMQEDMADETPPW